jgi:two-component system sensor kinase FixL
LSAGSIGARAPARLVDYTRLLRMRSTDSPRELSWLRAILLSVVYVFLYVFLDRVSFIHDLQHTEISPWGPQIALLCAMIMYFGPRFAPLTILAPGISEVVLRGAAPMGLQVIGSMACIGCTYTGAGLLLRRLQRDFSQPTIGWFAILFIVIASSALLDALLYSGVLIGSGNLSEGTYLEAARIEWVGDMSGIIILLPLLLLLRSGDRGKLNEMRSHIGLLLIQAAALAGAFWISFHDTWEGADGVNQTPFYLLFLPIVWIALRWGPGLTAIALATLQVGIVAFVAKHSTAESFRAIQLLMVLLAGTGLFMGISVSENARFVLLMRSKDDELSSLKSRMAVSEMNSAIGHELNNPLAALVNYLRSASLILELPDFDRVSLQSTLDKARGEATRSVNVVRKLREFFRSGVVRRQSVDPKKLAAEALAALQPKFRKAVITAVLDAQGDFPVISVDPLQISMVLQNLLANAYDAVLELDRRSVGVTLSVARRAGDVVFSVEDGGGGIPEALRDQIFRPISSAKSAGMGLGLAICRSLVEANDGRIWLVHTGPEGTCLAFSIPLDIQVVDEVRA